MAKLIHTAGAGVWTWGDSLRLRGEVGVPETINSKVFLRRAATSLELGV